MRESWYAYPMLRFDGAETEPVIVPVPAGPSTMLPVTVIPIWPSATNTYRGPAMGIKANNH